MSMAIFKFDTMSFFIKKYQSISITFKIKFSQFYDLSKAK